MISNPLVSSSVPGVGDGISGLLTTGIPIILPKISNSGVNSIGGLSGTSRIILSPGVYPIPVAVGIISTN